MRVCSPIITCLKSVVLLGECAQKQMSSSLCVVSQSPSNACCLYVCSSNKKKGYIGMHTSKRISGSSITNFQAFRGYCFQPGSFKQKGNLHTFSVNSSTSSQAVNNSKVDISLLCQNMNVRVLLPKQGILSKIKLSVGRMSWPRRCASAGILFGLLVAYSSSKPALAEAARSNEGQNGRCTSSVSSFSHGKKVFTDYSVTGIPGDGRCQFRSVVHGACLRSGNPAPTESFQRELADELRARVADEFVKRRKETEWFIEGDFDAYVSQIRKPHVWGGEPELLMASHVLRMPITVYMHDDDSGGLISIAEYGEEYGKENPIMVLYHGFGHYDALQIPGKGPNSRL